MSVPERTSTATSPHSNGRPGPASSEMRCASSRASAARQTVTSPSVVPNGSSPMASQQPFARSTRSRSTHGSIRAAAEAGPSPGGRSGSNAPSGQTDSNARSIALRSSGRLRKFVVSDAARPSA